MDVKLIKVKGTWRDVADAARTTIGMEAGTNEPSSNWKRKMLLCEHSPIRKIHINWKWINLKSWISVHFVRHKFGIEHWVKSQRPDRTGNRDNRDNAPQGTLIDHECEANPQAVINISRKRLCNQAMPETREAWKLFLKSLRYKEPELYSVCVPDCIYRGWCYEYKSCGFHKTNQFKEQLNKYRININDWEVKDN
jgi:hypothetical protein